MNEPKFRLIEMPKRITPQDKELGFKVTKNNSDLAKEILKSNKSLLIETTQLGNQLYRSGNRFILIDPHHVKVLYYMKWEDIYFKLLGITVTKEVLQWRDRGVFESRNLTSHVFFDLLLPLRSVVMTDIKHSDPEERFWLKIIDEAFDRNLLVYFINFLQTDVNNNHQVTLLKNKLDFRALLISSDNKQTPWGEEDKYMARRIVITTKILHNSGVSE
jgi:hypothetical protein